MPTAPQPSTIKTSLGDYPTLTLWKADIPANTTGLGEFRAINYIAGLVEGAGVPFTGFTTTAADPIVLDGSGLAFTGVAGGGAWVDTGASGSGTLIRMSDNTNFFNLYKMELRGRNGQTALHFCLNCGAGSLYKIDSSLIHSDDQLPINAFAANGNYEFTNTGFYAGNASRVLDIRGVTSCKLYYDTFWAPACDFTLLGDGACTAKDTVAGGATSHCIWSIFGILGTYCATTDADATTLNPGTGGVNNITGSSVFISVTPGAENFKLKSGTNALVDAGNAISGITVDAIGTTRPQGSAPDIGFNERLGGTTYNESVSESASAADAPSSNATLPSTIAETASAADAPASTATLPSTIAEAASAANTQTTTATLPNTITEAMNATDTEDAPPAGVVNIVEVMNAVDTVSAVVIMAVNIVEVMNAANTQDSIGTLPATVAEAATITDTLSAKLIGVATIAEVATAADAYISQLLANVAITEAANALDTLAISSAILMPSKCGSLMMPEIVRSLNVGCECA